MKKRSILKQPGFAATLLFFVLVIAFCIAGFRSTRAGTESEGLAATDSMIRRAVTECYALEGVYPPDLAYLETNYGIKVDTSRYYVYYRAAGENILPEIVVGSLQKEGSK